MWHTESDKTALSTYELATQFIDLSNAFEKAKSVSDFEKCMKVYKELDRAFPKKRSNNPKLGSIYKELKPIKKLLQKRASYSVHPLKWADFTLAFHKSQSILPLLKIGLALAFSLILINSVLFDQPDFFIGLIVTALAFVSFSLIHLIGLLLFNSFSALLLAQYYQKQLPKCEDYALRLYKVAIIIENRKLKTGGMYADPQPADGTARKNLIWESLSNRNFD